MCKKGGMDARNLKKQNQSLMMKWLWKFANGDNMLLKDVITANYGMSDEWMTSMVAILYGCTMWRAIRNLWPLKLSRTRIKVGKGFRAHFGMTSG